MSLTAILILVLAEVAVFAIAAVVIGREAHRLDAVDYVADHLPPESQAHLTHDEVRRLLQLHMGQLRRYGLQPPAAVDQVQGIDRVVVEETDAAGYLMGQVDAAGMDVDDVDVVNVVDAHLAYFDSIGAVGPPAADDVT